MTRSNEEPPEIPNQTERAQKFLDTCEDPRLCREAAERQLADEFANAFLAGMNAGLQHGLDERVDLAKKIHAQRTQETQPEAVVWADEATPFTGEEVRALLDENEALRKALSRAECRFPSELAKLDGCTEGNPCSVHAPLTSWPGAYVAAEKAAEAGQVSDKATPHCTVVQPDGYIVAEGSLQFCEGALFTLKAYTTSDAYEIKPDTAPFSHRSECAKLLRLFGWSENDEGYNTALDAVVHAVDSIDTKADPRTDMKTDGSLLTKAIRFLNLYFRDERSPWNENDGEVQELVDMMRPAQAPEDTVRTMGAAVLNDHGQLLPYTCEPTKSQCEEKAERMFADWSTLKELGCKIVQVEITVIE